MNCSFFQYKPIDHEHLLKGHTTTIQSIDVCEENKQLISLATGGDLRLWNLVTGACTLALSLPVETHSVRFCDQGKQFATANNSPHVHIYEPTSGKIIKTLEHTEHISFISFATIFGKKALITCPKNSRTSYIWNLEDSTKSCFDRAYNCRTKTEPVYYRTKGTSIPTYTIKKTKDHHLSCTIRNKHLTLCSIAVQNDPTTANFQSLIFSRYAQNNLTVIERNTLSINTNQ